MYIHFQVNRGLRWIFSRPMMIVLPVEYSTIGKPMLHLSKVFSYENQHHLEIFVGTVWLIVICNSWFVWVVFVSLRCFIYTEFRTISCSSQSTSRCTHTLFVTFIKILFSHITALFSSSLAFFFCSQHWTQYFAKFYKQSKYISWSSSWRNWNSKIQCLYNVEEK